MKIKIRLLSLGLSIVAIVAILGTIWTPDQTRQSLESQYAKPPSQFMEVLGNRVHLRDTGEKNAPAILMIHGFGASLHTWDTWATLLEKDYRIIRLDLPGFGLTGPEVTNNYSDDRTNAILLEILRQLEIPQVVVIGNSIGGRIAWYFTSQYPQQVSHVILLSPDGFQSPGMTYGRAHEVPIMMSGMQWVMPKWLLKANLVPAYDDPASLQEDLLSRYFDLMLLPGVRSAMLERMRQTILKDPIPYLKTIQQPTLILWGESDRLIPVSNAQDYVKVMPHATLQALKKVGHLPQEEKANKNIKYVVEFLDSTK